MAKPETLAARLTPAQRRALIEARRFDNSELPGLYLRLDVRADVRGRLYELGLLTKRPPYPLNMLGREVRDCLIGASK